MVAISEQGARLDFRRGVGYERMGEDADHRLELIVVTLERGR
jgi:hypothetical protein